MLRTSTARARLLPASRGPVGRRCPVGASLVLGLTVVLVALNTAPVGHASQPDDVTLERRQAGGVVAELSYRASGQPPRYTDWRVWILRGRVLVVDNALALQGQSGSASPAAPGHSLRIAELDGDGEPEIVVAYYEAGTGCRHKNLIWRYVDGQRRYLVEDLADNSPCQIRDLGRDGTPELVALDCRFYGLVVASAGSRFPLRVLCWRPSAVLDVTRRYPAEVRADAARHLRDARTAARRGEADLVRTAFVPYLAGQYVLGRGLAGWEIVVRSWRRGELKGDAFSDSPRAYLRRLCAGLVRLGYE